MGTGAARVAEPSHHVKGDLLHKKEIITAKAGSTVYAEAGSTITAEAGSTVYDVKARSTGR